MRSPRAAVNIRTGIEINPKVRWPFQTVAAMRKLLRWHSQGCLNVPMGKVSRPMDRMQDEFMVGNAHLAKCGGPRGWGENRDQRSEIWSGSERAPTPRFSVSVDS